MIRQASAQSLDLLRTSAWGLRPFVHPDAPVLLGRAGVARDEVDVHMGHPVSEHKGVDVFSTLAGDQRPA